MSNLRAGAFRGSGLRGTRSACGDGIGASRSEIVLQPHLLILLADLGDIAVIAPALTAASVVLAARGRRRDAIAWLLALAVCALITITLKTFVGSFAFSLFDRTIRAVSFPSGHAAITVVFYDGLAALLWFGSRALLPRLLAAALALLQAAIVVAVWRLHWHPLVDIVCGLALGALCLAAAWWRVVPKPAARGELAGIALVAAAVVLALHGERLDDKALVDRMLGRTPVESSLAMPTAG
jgi:membrane-associated phospholipid phosphatase